MLTLGHETIYFVFEEYCHHALTRSATSGYDRQLPFRNIQLCKQSQQAARLGKLMTFNSSFNFKLS
jgi:hypothetical protein